MPNDAMESHQPPNFVRQSARSAHSTATPSSTTTSIARSKEPGGSRTERMAPAIQPSRKRSRFATVASNADQPARNQTSCNSSSRHMAPPQARSSCMFRLAARMYAERKLLLVAMAHAVATLTIWAHFFLIKCQEQEDSVPSSANRYWAKRLIPPLEFGTMHAILFQMALIPLTMSRLSIASLSTSFWNRYIPFNRMIRLHIYLGYVMVSVVTMSTIVFFVFFGLLCSDGEQSFCDKFTTEMMITGYLLVLMLLVVAITSYFRYHIPYETFYVAHHLVFIMFFLAIVHTFDQAQREDMKDRSQTFRWFAVPLVYYICDRAAMYMGHRYKSIIFSSSTVTSRMGSPTIILRIRRPLTFFFRPGQYCLLRVSSIDRRWWHPFSLSSSPHSDLLEFCMDVHRPSSWTGQLCDIIQEAGGHGEEKKKRRTSKQGAPDLSISNQPVHLEVKGPYGTGFGQLEKYSHALAIGGGTGIVPMLSLLKHHIYHMRGLEPQVFLGDCAVRNERLGQLRSENETRPGTMWREMVAKVGGEVTPHPTNGVETIFLSLLLLLLPVCGVAVLGMTLSWNTMPIELYSAMIVALKLVTVLFQLAFGIVVFFVHEASSFPTYLDLAVLIISCFADWFWFATDRWGSFEAPDLIYSTLIHGYMTFRCWHTAVRPMKHTWRQQVGSGCGSTGTFDKLSFVWVTRSAPLVSKIIPDIIHIHNSIVNAWGLHAANKVCDISIYITDKDQAACDALKAEIGHSSLFKSGAVRFGRPDLQKLIEDHTLDRINDERGVPTTTLLAFCGSPSLSSEIQQAKIKNDISAAITGNGHHQMEFVSESYGPIHKSMSSRARQSDFRGASSPTKASAKDPVQDRTAEYQGDGETFATLSEIGWDDCSFGHDPVLVEDTTKFSDIFSLG